MPTLVDDDVVVGDSSHGSDQKTELPGRVAQWYYKHGLFLSSYPACATGIAVFVILLSCYPLLNIPMPGTTPTKIMLPRLVDAALPISTPDNPHHTDPVLNAHPARNLFNFSFDATPFPWDRTEPFMFVQQIVLRSQVVPWPHDGQMQLTDAFRGPLHEVFKLLETVRNHEDPTSQSTLGDLCLHVENIKRPDKADMFPEYNCLILSPANFWQQSVHNFNQDPNLLNTIFHNHNLMKSKVSTAEMLLGMQVRDTGIKRYPIRVRPRIVQYAITLVLQHNDQQFLTSLRDKLTRMYPLHQTERTHDEVPVKRAIHSNTSIMYVYYPGEFNWLEFTPLAISFVMLFVYVYFSVRKIDEIKSRALLATCAVITVFSSLMMSLGLCFFFDLTTRMQSKGVFQYLIILLGLENVLVITKSVISTDNTFDVKIRLAQGLSKEGWTISKTLLTEITILTIGLATFVPVIQEFCVFAIVGLISDFFLQMMLFSTVLAMDLKRVDIGDLRKVTPNTVDNHHRRIPFRNSTITSSMTINRSRSHPKLTALDTPSDLGVANGSLRPTKTGEEPKIPKRLRIVNFWARTRFFQRAFMLWMILWIGSIIYNSQILEQLFVFETNNESDSHTIVPPFGASFVANESGDVETIDQKPVTPTSDEHLQNERNSKEYIREGPFNVSDQMQKLKHSEYETQFFLSNFHWSTILRQYNISLSGRYVAVLPAIKLSHAISATDAIRIRNPNELPIQHFQWKALAIALDPIDFTDLDADVDAVAIQASAALPQEHSTPLYPKSPMEILLASILCAISISVLTYTMVVFYRCICTRNYAEWRSSWNDTDDIHPKRQRILEGVPILVRGHTHRIECLVTDGEVVASSCLDGQVKMWDVNHGELIASIDRNGYFRMNQQLSVASTQDIQRVVRPASSSHRQRTSESWSPIWCLDYLDNLIAIGCADGRLEFWEASTGNLKCICECDPNQAKNGVTNLRLAGNRVVAARLSGRVDFLRLESYTQGRQIDWGFTSAYRRTHVRAGSTGSMKNFAATTGATSSINPREELRCVLELQQQGHQQPLTCMDVVGGTVFTGSQDHTLKVFELDTGQLLFTLHGHCGPITCLFIDHYQPDTGGSGSQDGLLCVWELLTGACMYSIQAHDGAIVSLVCAPSYVISVGADERLCVWERFQGNLLNTINVTHIYTSLLMLTPSLLVTGKPGSLIVWDVRSGEPTREVKLDCVNLHVTPKLLLPASGSVVCDYGNELRIVRFPLIADKQE